MSVVFQHFNVRRFQVEGVFGSDADLPRLRIEIERTLRVDMKDAGYIPVFDLETHWSTEYDTVKDQYLFRCSVYGARVGKRRAKQWSGITNGQALSIPQTKSKRSSETAK